jgi:drug/metabolite transporter (DMT)-like permease
MAMVGALILLRPGPQTFQVAALLALGAAVLMGMELILIKKLTRKEGPFQILLVNNTLGLIISSVAVVVFWVMPTPLQWAALVAIGMMMAAAQACFVNAMARADASFVTPFSYVTLIFAAAYDLLVFDVWPDGVSWLGACVILAGAALLAWREAHNRSVLKT